MDPSGLKVMLWEERLAETTKGGYRCSFCKRGFSNAQALGGHMNVHRRDRAYKINHHQLPDDHKDKLIVRRQGPSSEKTKIAVLRSAELDLELRLGPT